MSSSLESPALSRVILRTALLIATSVAAVYVARHVYQKLRRSGSSSSSKWQGSDRRGRRSSSSGRLPHRGSSVQRTPTSAAAAYSSHGSSGRHRSQDDCGTDDASSPSSTTSSGTSSSSIASLSLASDEAHDAQRMLPLVASRGPPRVALDRPRAPRDGVVPSAFDSSPHSARLPPRDSPHSAFGAASQHRDSPHQQEQQQGFKYLSKKARHRTSDAAAAAGGVATADAPGAPLSHTARQPPPPARQGGRKHASSATSATPSGPSAARAQSLHRESSRTSNDKRRYRMASEQSPFNSADDMVSAELQQHRRQEQKSRSRGRETRRDSDNEKDADRRGGSSESRESPTGDAAATSHRADRHPSRDRPPPPQQRSRTPDPGERFLENLRLLQLTKLRILQNAKGFRNVPKHVMEHLAHAMQHRSFSQNEVIITKGDNGDCVYFVASGVVHVLAGDPVVETTTTTTSVSKSSGSPPADGSSHTATKCWLACSLGSLMAPKPKVINKLEEGEYFGEFCIFSCAMRSATCIAASRMVDCFTLHRDVLIETSNSCSVLRSSIEEVMFLKIVSAEYPHEVRKRPDVEKQILAKTAELIQQAEEKRRQTVACGRSSVSDITLEKKIGKGASGEVWSGRDANGRPCAVKRINTRDMSLKSILQVQQEVALLEVLSHPNVVESYGSFTDRPNSMIHIVLEYLPMGSLQKQIRAHRGPFTEAQARMYSRQLLSGLRYLHSRSILHRDIKPANALISAKGVVKLADFGICLRTLALKTVTLTGTPAYLAPEVVELGAYSVGSDIWALGCTLLELVTGYPPWSDQISATDVEVTALIYRIALSKVPTIPPCLGATSIATASTSSSDGISLPLHRLLHRMLNPDPALRGTCDDLLQEEWFTMDAEQMPKTALSPRLDLVARDYPPTVTSNSLMGTAEDEVTNGSFPDSTVIVTSDGPMTRDKSSSFLASPHVTK